MDFFNSLHNSSILPSRKAPDSRAVVADPSARGVRGGASPLTLDAPQFVAPRSPANVACDVGSVLPVRIEAGESTDTSAAHRAGRPDPGTSGVDRQSVSHEEQESQMRTTINMWAGPKRLAAALGLFALVAGTSTSTVEAGTMPDPASASASFGAPVPTNLVYNTSGVVGTTGIKGTNVIGFVPVSNSAVQTSTSLSLGTFVVTPLPDSQTTVYNHTPFAISYATHSVNGVDVSASQPLLTLTGFFNGQVTGKDQSNVVATFDPISNPQFALTPSLNGFLALPSPQRTLVPSTTFGGQSTAEGFIIVRAAPIPEPTAIALLVLAGAGLGLRRRFKVAK